MAKRPMRTLLGDKALSLSAVFLVTYPTRVAATEWINWNNVWSQDTTTTTTTPEPGFKELFCKNYPETPVVCAKLLTSRNATTPESAGECGPNDPRCCKASSCYSVPISGLGCWEQRGTTQCVGSGLSLNGGVYFKRGTCMCATGVCSENGHCPDATNQNSLVIPGAHTWGDSLEQTKGQLQETHAQLQASAQDIHNKVQKSVQDLQSTWGTKFKVGDGSVVEVKVPPENVERTLAMLLLASLSAVAASVTLGVRFARHLLRPSVATSAEAQPLAPQPVDRPDGQLDAEEEQP